jgi:hypothetical protein
MAGQSDAVRMWKYTAAAGKFFRLRAKTAIVAQQTGGAAVKVGGTAAAVSDPLPPRGFRPRKCYVTDASGHKRSVVCYEESAPLFTAGEVITLQYAGSETVFTSAGGTLGQKLPAGITDPA